MACLWLYTWVTTGSSTGMILQGMVKDVKLWNLPIVMACFTLDGIVGDYNDYNP